RYDICLIVGVANRLRFSGYLQLFLFRLVMHCRRHKHAATRVSSNSRGGCRGNAALGGGPEQRPIPPGLRALRVLRPLPFFALAISIFLPVPSVLLRRLSLSGWQPDLHLLSSSRELHSSRK